MGGDGELRQFQGGTSLTHHPGGGRPTTLPPPSFLASQSISTFFSLDPAQSLGSRPPALPGPQGFPTDLSLTFPLPPSPLCPFHLWPQQHTVSAQGRDQAARHCGAVEAGRRADQPQGADPHSPRGSHICILTHRQSLSLTHTHSHARSRPERPALPASEPLRGVENETPGRLPHSRNSRGTVAAAEGHS